MGGAWLPGEPTAINEMMELLDPFPNLWGKNRGWRSSSNTNGQIAGDNVIKMEA